MKLSIEPSDKPAPMLLGDGLSLLAVIVWLSVTVGPVYLGLAIVVLATAGNYLSRRRTR